MADRVLEFAAKERQEKRELSHLSRSDISSIIARKQIGRGVAPTGHHLAVAGGAQRRLRRAGGGSNAKVPRGLGLEFPKEFSEKVMAQFKLGTTADGNTILLRMCTRDDPRGARHLPVVALEDLPTLFQQQMESLGVTGPTALFKHLYHNMPTHLAPGPDGAPRVVFGLTGFTKDTVKVYVKQDPYYADQQPLGAAEKAPPAPIIIRFVFQQCQMDLLDVGADRDPRFRYVLVYIELFSRRVWLRALTSKEAVGVAREVYFLFEGLVVPSVLQSDNGTEFCAAVMQRLCAMYGVKHVQGSVGHPQSQGAVERANKIVKDKIRAELMRAPTTTWPQHVLRVESMINNQPCTMFNQGKTRNQMLLGALSQHTKRPSTAELASLLGFSSSADAINDHAAARALIELPPTVEQQRRRPASTGTKRKAAAAGLEADLAEEEALAAEATGTKEVAAVVGRRSSRSARGARLEELLLAEQQGDEEEAAPMRALPQRASALRSPAGHRRQQARLLDQLAAAAEEAEEEATAAERAAEEEADAGQPAAASRPELPEHLVALRVAGEQDHARNRARIASQGRNGRKAKTFFVGDNVLLVPQKCGHAGGATIDPQSIVCRVVGVHRPGGHTKYKLRCNGGLLEGLFFPSQIRVAPQLSAATLTFTGVDTKDVRPVSLAGAKAQLRVGGAAAAPCRCRGKCTSRCKCKGSCSRACGCNGFCNGRH